MIFLTLFNAAIAALTLTAIGLTLRRVVDTGEMRYTVFLEIFRNIAWIEFAAAIVMMPALTAGSISGERERKTLDLMLTTRMTTAEIIFGKLTTALSFVLTLLITGTPVFTAVLLFGGANLSHLAGLELCIVLGALFAGSTGLFFSAMSRRTTVAVAASYGMLLVTLFLPVSVLNAALEGITGQTSQIPFFLSGGSLTFLHFRHPVISGGVLMLCLSVLLLIGAALKISPGFHKPHQLGGFSSNRDLIK